ncbi:MAG: triphosphoribosyl-dephospho-CoA synthase [Methylotenera sp.]|nr:triphosphoribosyl-dephospho-CoA synthase [Methylotenera sp.]
MPEKYVSDKYTPKYTPNYLAEIYKNACMAELQALKPGNVHVFADGHGMTIYDFIQSADITANVITQPNLSVGERIFNAVAATQKAVGLNTNLGLILLCAPLIHATLQGNANNTFQQNLHFALSQLSVSDAQLTAQAIVLANPAGLGDSSEHDVNHPLNVTLLEMMRSAQHKDRIAWQFANEFSDIFEFGLACFNKALIKWQDISKSQHQAWATTALYLGFMARQSDTHIIRKHGQALASSVMHEARAIETAYWAADNPKLMQKQLLAWDASLKVRNINPGSSADLTVACLLAAYLV